MFGLRALRIRLAITFVIELEILIEKTSDSLHLELVGGLEVIAGPGLYHYAPYQISINGLD